jgi:polar amino acid transport system substrate-binding protein
MSFWKSITKLGSVAALAAVIASPGAAQAETVLEKVKREGVLKVCLAQTTPDNYIDPRNGQWTGVFIDILDELATWMKVKIEPVEVQFSTVILALNRGDCDLFGSSLLYNAPRAMEINYITPFAAKGINGVVAADKQDRFKSVSDLNSPDVTIAVVAGSRDYEVAQRDFPEAKLLALQVTTDLAAFESVRRGDADIALANGITIRWWTRVEGNEWAAPAFDSDFSTQPNGWAIRYGDPDWKNFLDSFADWVLANNMAGNLYDAYLSRTSLFDEVKK